ncbi:MAG: helix-turn-helix domain-containing protein [Candidatus Woesearchaeota archaeon]
MDVEVLEELGLTKSEIKTYMTLLELGSSNAGRILEKSGLQNSVMHKALNSLIGKGIINYVLEGRRKIYTATDPEHFIEFIDDKKTRFQELLPELKKKQNLLRTTVEAATIYKGTRGVTEVYNFMVKQKGEYNTFGGGEECAGRMGMSWWLNIHTKRVANKLRARQVYDETVRKDAGGIESKPLTAIRYLSKEFASFQETVIVGDYVAITVFNENAYSFLMHDAKIAKSYRQYFELLWNMAKP